MERAYDIGALVERLKQAGIEVAEDGAREAFKTTMEWVKESAAKSESKLDDVIVGVIAPLEDYVLEQIDTIDGAVG